MPVIRAFIAIELPEPLQRDLDKIAVPLRRQMVDLPLRWVKIPNIHLTLKFLGQTQQQDIPRISAALQSRAEQAPPFEVQITELGAFPNPQKPLVLWVGLTEPEALTQLQRGIEADMVDLGFAPEGREFTPHLTLARARRDHREANLKRMGGLLATAQVPASAPVSVESITLFRSDLKPGGSVYNPLARNPLLG